MKIQFFLLFLLGISHLTIGQKTQSTGLASYYSNDFHGRRTASGEKFNMNAFTSAHRSLPFNTLIKVTNLGNGKSTIVRVNDRGPAKKARVIDLSFAAAKEIGLVQRGVGKVKVELVDSSSLDPHHYRMIAGTYAEVEAFEPIKGFGINGERNKNQYLKINENTLLNGVSKQYVTDSISKIKISPIFSYSVITKKDGSVNKKKRRRNDHGN